MIVGEMWKEFVDESLAGTAIFDLDTYAYLYVNKVFSEATGYSEEEIIEKHHLTFLAHPEDRERLLSVLEDVRAGKNFFSEFRYVKKNGEVRWV
ncbi:MAG: hypothetical protein PWQ22_1638, partial [Archaeoglobaceae archaeon]|nr:hypothetical protein [Archaeoglobaceae archaeon]